jgi:hypothetical protein
MLAGFILGYYVLIIFGFVLLFPALLIPSQKPPQRPAEQKKEPERRPSPPIQPLQPVQVPRTPMPAIVTETPRVSMSALPSASSPLFPTVMFPSLSLPPPQPTPAPEAKQAPAESRDEVLEYGVLLAILKLVLG